MPNFKLGQKGIVPVIGVLIALAAIGFVTFLLVASSASFKNHLFGGLFPKPASFAQTLSGPILPSPSPSVSPSPSPIVSPSPSPSGVRSAQLTLSPGTANVALLQDIPLTVNFRSDIDAVNLVKARLDFDPSKIEVTSIDTTGSFITTWVENNVINNSAGKVSLTGGVPSPGFKTNGVDAKMAVVHLRAKTTFSGATNIAIVVPPSVAYRNSDSTDILIAPTGAAPYVTVVSEITPLPSPTPTLSPSPTPVLSPSPSPTPIACAIQNVDWQLNGLIPTAPVSEGQQMIIKVTSNGGACAGNTLDFAVKEDDGILGSIPALISPASQIWNAGNILTVPWTAEYIQDGAFGLFDPPEYLAAVTLKSGSQTLQTVNSGLLQVNATGSGTPVILIKGDGNRNGLIDLQDLSLLLSNWNKDKTINPVDFPDLLDLNQTPDGKINTFDFSEMLQLLINNGVIVSP